VNDAPTVQVAGGSCLSETVARAVLNLPVADVDDVVGSLSVSATSDNQTLLPNGGLEECRRAPRSSWALPPTSLACETYGRWLPRNRRRLMRLRRTHALRRSGPSNRRCEARAISYSLAMLSLMYRCLTNMPDPA
jgi:hypothetical protein